MKVNLFETELYRIRYVVKDNEILFFASDISRILNVNYEEYVSAEDKTSISYTNKIGKIDNAYCINIYAVGYLISCAMLKTNNSPANELKSIIYTNIIPMNTNHCMSEEDKIVLKIVKANTDIEKAKYISDFKNLILKENKDHQAKAKKSGDIYSIRDINDRFGLKRGQLTLWASKNGLFEYGGISGKSPVIKEDGKMYFKLYKDGQSVGKLGITYDGLNLIIDNIEEIRNIKRV